MKNILILMLFALGTACSGCGGGSGGSSSSSSAGGETPVANPPPAPSPPPSTDSSAVRLNQLGFMPSSNKLAVLANATATNTRFELIQVSDNSVVMSGDLSSASTWDLSGETVKVADFSSVTAAGEYRLRVNGIAQDSLAFRIGNDIFDDLHSATLKAYYFNRASTALEAEHAGDWARALGHPDTEVIVDAAAATASRPAGTVISAPKGWYDAGDFNKYVVNSGISTYTLLAAYEHYSTFYNAHDGGIPESGDAIPDILDEVKWNLDWLVNMQDTDGGVYHKLTHERFSGNVMPSEATTPRYVVQKGTSAALNFAAVMAVASRIFSDYEASFPGLAAQYRSAAMNAYDWAKTNPNIAYQQSFSVTGEYGDNNFEDEFSWAAAELFILTGEQQYWDDFEAQTDGLELPGWPEVSSLPYISLAFHADDVLTNAQKNEIEADIVSYVDLVLSRSSTSPYRVPMFSENFVWGSNSSSANQGMMALQAYRITGDDQYKQLAVAAADYLLGRNAVGFSFVTGFGETSPQNPHHRQSVADSVAAPVPGFLVGGPNPGRQDNCPNYIGSESATSYVDTYCSYASNEVTINWNAPMVYLLGGLIAGN